MGIRTCSGRTIWEDIDEIKARLTKMEMRLGEMPEDAVFTIKVEGLDPKPEPKMISVEEAKATVRECLAVVGKNMTVIPARDTRERVDNGIIYATLTAVQQRIMYELERK